MHKRAFTLITAAVLGAVCVPASAAGYDILVVACDGSDCSRIVERTIAASSDGKTALRQDDFQLEIKALAQGTDGLLTRIVLDYLAPRDAAESRPRSGGARSGQRMQVVQEPCTLKSGTFIPLAPLASDGRIYHTWVRLAAR